MEQARLHSGVYYLSADRILTTAIELGNDRDGMQQQSRADPLFHVNGDCVAGLAIHHQKNIRIRARQECLGYEYSPDPDQISGRCGDGL